MSETKLSRESLSTFKNSQKTLRTNKRFLQAETKALQEFLKIQSYLSRRSSTTEQESIGAFFAISQVMKMYLFLRNSLIMKTTNLKVNVTIMCLRLWLTRKVTCFQELIIKVHLWPNLSVTKSLLKQQNSYNRLYKTDKQWTQRISWQLNSRFEHSHHKLL